MGFPISIACAPLARRLDDRTHPVISLLVYFDAVGVFSLEGHPVLRALTWSSSLCFAAASILCLVPASKRAADAARTLNGLPIA